VLGQLVDWTAGASEILHLRNYSIGAIRTPSAIRHSPMASLLQSTPLPRGMIDHVPVWQHRRSSNGSTGPPVEGRWTKIGVILTALGVVVAAVALLPKGGTSPSPPGPVPQTSPPFVTPTTDPPTWTPRWTPAPSSSTADISTGPRHVPGPGAPTAQPPPNGGPTLAVTHS
jgi:hypothetical protein